MKRVMMALAMLSGLVGAHDAAAQSPLPLALQIGGGYVIPTGEFADVASNGYGFSVGTGFQIVPNLSLYVGYAWTRFDADVVGMGDITDSGFSTGLTLIVPQLGPNVLPWLGGGLVLHQLSVSGAAEQPGWGDPGFGLGAGLLVPVTPNVRFSPSLGYVHYRNSFPTRLDDMTVSYLSLGIAFNVSP